MLDNLYEICDIYVCVMCMMLFLVMLNSWFLFVWCILFVIFWVKYSMFWLFGDIGLLIWEDISVLELVEVI